MGEIASQKLRARTGGIAAGLSVLFGLTFNTSVPVICEQRISFPFRVPLLTFAVDTEGADWGYDLAWLFLGTGIFVTAVVWFYTPEPMCRNAAEMDEMYEKGVPAWKMKKYVTEVQTARQM